MNTKLEVIQFVCLQTCSWRWPPEGWSVTLTCFGPLNKELWHDPQILWLNFNEDVLIKNNNFRWERMTTFGASQALLSYQSWNSSLSCILSSPIPSQPGSSRFRASRSERSESASASITCLEWWSISSATWDSMMIPSLLQLFTHPTPLYNTLDSAGQSAARVLPLGIVYIVGQSKWRRYQVVPNYQRICGTVGHFMERKRYLVIKKEWLFPMLRLLSSKAQW